MRGVESKGDFIVIRSPFIANLNRLREEKAMAADTKTRGLELEKEKEDTEHEREIKRRFLTRESID